MVDCMKIQGLKRTELGGVEVLATRIAKPLPLEECAGRSSADLKDDRKTAVESGRSRLEIFEKLVTIAHEATEPKANSELM